MTWQGVHTPPSFTCLTEPAEELLPTAEDVSSIVGLRGVYHPNNPKSMSIAVRSFPVGPNWPTGPKESASSVYNVLPLFAFYKAAIKCPYKYQPSMGSIE